jgi:hypothetical protein
VKKLLEHWEILSSCLGNNRRDAQACVLKVQSILWVVLRDIRLPRLEVWIDRWGGRRNLSTRVCVVNADDRDVDTCGTIFFDHSRDPPCGRLASRRSRFP